MKTKVAGLSLAAVAAFGAPAFAGGDVIYTGVKDPYAAAVPVPAPAPIPIYEPEYYVRFDVGAAWLSDGSLDETGSSMTIDDIGDVEPLEFGSIGAGRYITPSIRVELAVDWYTRGDLQQGTTNFTEVASFDVGLADPDVVTYDVTRQDSVKFEQDTGMLNFYYDFRNSSRFTPYVGAGIGVTYRQLTRTSSEVANCATRSNAGDPTRNTCPAVAPAPADPAVITEGTSTKKSWDLAAAVMAGLSVQVTDSIIWDTGYRYMWQNGGLTISSLTLTGTSDITIEDVGQHQLRTGIRLDLN
ncbi:MAG: outer membrane beta-barrel protein [Hyphomicrobium sp.]|nr:outer membrane beta-barrel protein [Hyphomicrobium sp.]